jgi:hypothetical protein
MPKRFVIGLEKSAKIFSFPSGRSNESTTRQGPVGCYLEIGHDHYTHRTTCNTGTAAASRPMMKLLRLPQTTR